MESLLSLDNKQVRYCEAVTLIPVKTMEWHHDDNSSYSYNNWNIVHYRFLVCVTWGQQSAIMALSSVDSCYTEKLINSYLITNDKIKWIKWRRKSNYHSLIVSIDSLMQKIKDQIHPLWHPSYAKLDSYPDFTFNNRFRNKCSSPSSAL